MPCDWEELRKEMARLARQPKLRRCEWSTDMPCDWAPTQVETTLGLFFTDAGAWELIAELLDTDHPFSPVILRKPPGDVAYETTVRLREDLPTIYIKVQLKAGRIWGRSFHNSARAQ